MNVRRVWERFRCSAFRSYTCGQLFNQLDHNKKMTLLHNTHKLTINELHQRINYSSQVLTAQNRQPVTMKLDTPEFHAMFTTEMKHLINIFEKHNHELRIVGGAVRDLLMRRQPVDVDFASLATPDQMKTMFSQENIRTLKTEGESYGNVTVRINDKEDFQITTLRIDVASDGRFPKVEFTTDWYADACRRDFKINSMFLGFDGTVYDYLNGIEDVENRRVQFIDNPIRRIREDYLRILRYFRFYGRIAEDPNTHDSETLQAIKENISGLSGISGIKLWTELKKILSGNFRFELMKTILDVGMAPYIGLRSDMCLNEFKMLEKRTADFLLEPITIIVSLLKNEADLKAFDERMMLRRTERELGKFIINHKEDKHEDSMQFFRELMILTKENKSEIKERIEQFLSYHGDKCLLEEFKNWETPIFPVNNQNLINRGIKYGKQFHSIKQAMKERWLKSDFTLTEDDLLMKLDEIIQDLTDKKSKKKKKKNL